MGSTIVGFEPEPTLKEKILHRKLGILAVLLGLSILGNLLLILKQRGLLQRVREFEYELPDFRDSD